MGKNKQNITGWVATLKSHIPAHESEVTVAPFRAWRDSQPIIAGGPPRATIAAGIIGEISGVKQAKFFSLFLRRVSGVVPYCKYDYFDGMGCLKRITGF